MHTVDQLRCYDLVSRGDMREADMKCRLAICLLPSHSRDTIPDVPSLLRFLPIAASLTIFAPNE
jgi:hypothetical protein